MCTYILVMYCSNENQQKNINVMQNKPFTPKSTWITMVTASHWYDDMLQNWLLWFNNLQLEMGLILVAEDLPTFEKYHDSSFIVIYFDMNQVCVNISY